VTEFSFGPLVTCVGVLLLAAATFIAAVRVRSWLLRICALSLFVCAFSGAAYLAMPIRISTNGSSSIWPEHWVSWLAFVGAPLAMLAAGVAALLFVLLQSKKVGA
jgi:hypothetical protein